MEIKKNKPEIHVLLVAFAAQGHINPLLRLAKSLISKGLHVTLATTEIGRHHMVNSSTITSTTTSIAGVQLLFFSDGLSLDYDRKSNLDHYMESLAKFGPINLSNLIKTNYPINNCNKKLSRVISNPFVPWVIDVANELEIPCAMLWIQPCSLYAIYYRFYNKLNPFSTFESPEICVQVPGLPLLSKEDLPSFVLPSNQFSSLTKVISEVFLNLKKYKWVLGNSFFELEKDAIESMAELCPICPIGPLVPPSLLFQDHQEDQEIRFEMWKSEDSCIEWLNNQETGSVIYISFGSIVVLSEKQMEMIAKALKTANKPFLWMVKPSGQALPNRQGELPLGFLEETKEKGLVVSWSPQTKVLAHKAIGCFITHCGWNSILEAIVAGVPIIAFPQWTDQPTNAKLIVDVFRIGLRVRENQDGIVSNDEIEKCIEEILDGIKSKELKSSATELQRKAREAVAHGGSSDRNIQLFVDEIVGRSGSQDLQM